MNDEIYNKLKQIKIEDYIWLVYILIIFFSWYANTLERKYYVYNNQISKEKYRKMMILIFSILVVVYIYFLKNSIDDINNLKPWDSYDKKNLVNLSFIASLLIAASGFIFLYIALRDENLNVELAFN